MGLFGSRKKEVPRLPSTSVLPELPRTERKISDLPSIPAGNSTRDNLNEEMIKSAVNDQSLEGEEINKYEESNPRERVGGRIPSPPRYPPKSPISGEPQRETIFIKIDKFQNSLDALKEIENQVRDLSADIETLKEIKIKEAKELAAWDEELKKINSRLSKIDVNIFGEV